MLIENAHRDERQDEGWLTGGIFTVFKPCFLLRPSPAENRNRMLMFVDNPLYPV